MKKVNTQNINKFDVKKRLVYDFEPKSEILHKYKYDDKNLLRTITITNKKNKSNFKTTIIQKLVDEEYINQTKKEHGEVYVLITTYRENGEIKTIEQINKKKKTNLVKEYFKNNKLETEIIILNYNNKKSIHFKSDINKINKNGKK